MFLKAERRSSIRQAKVPLQSCLPDIPPNVPVLKKILKIPYVYECFGCLSSLQHVCAWCPWKSEEGVRSRGTGEIDGYMPPYGIWEPNHWSFAVAASALNS